LVGEICEERIVEAHYVVILFDPWIDLDGVKIVVGANTGVINESAWDGGLVNG
jgi:hypothetical protein